MKKLITIFLLSFGLNASAAHFTIGTIGGSINLTSMSGHSFGDTAYIADGTYTGGTWSNLNGITMLPLSGNTAGVYITGLVNFTTNKFVTIRYMTWINCTGSGLQGDASNNNNITITNCRWINCGAVCMHFNGTWPWTSGDTTTLQLYKIFIDSVYEYACPALLSSGFGDMTQNHPNPSNVSDSVIITHFISTATTGGAPTSTEEGTEIRFAGCFRLNCYYWAITSTTQRGPSADDGNIYVKGGNGTFHDIYRNGGPGAVVRIYGLAEPSHPRNCYTYNCSKFNGTCYSFEDFRFDPNMLISGATQSCGFQIIGNTYVNGVDNAAGYGANMVMVGNIDSLQPHTIKNNFGANIQRSNGSTYIIKNQSSGTYTYGDSSNNQYWASATLAQADSITAIITNSLGSFAGYAPTINSPGLLHGGTTNPFTTIDYLGHPLRTPPDIGYLQYYLAPTPPVNPNKHTFIIYKP